MFHDPTFWVLVAFVIFIVVAAKYVPSAFNAAVDAKIEKIRSRVDEAQTLLVQAEALYKKYKEDSEQVTTDVEQILGDAHADANHLIDEEKIRIKDVVARKKKQTSERIKTLHDNALRAIRDDVLDQAFALAKVSLESHFKNAADAQRRQLIDTSIENFSKQIH